MHRQHIRGVLEAVAESAHYPESSAAEVLEGGDAAADPDALQAAEAEAAAAERRAELFVLFRNASKVAPEEGYAVTGTLLQRLVSQPSTEFRVSALCSFSAPPLQRILHVLSASDKQFSGCHPHHCLLIPLLGA